jgi:hypothetical protein
MRGRCMQPSVQFTARDTTPRIHGQQWRLSISRTAPPEDHPRAVERVDCQRGLDPTVALKNTGVRMEFPHNRREADNSYCASNAGRSSYGCRAPEPGIGVASPTGESMEQVPLSFLVAVTIGFVLAGLLNTITDVPPVLIVILFMGGLAAYLEYYFRSKP